MPKLIKVLLSIIGAAVFLVSIGMLSILFLIDPNDYKAQLNQHVTAKLGQEFAIRGAISWSFFPWLGLQAQDVRISNAEGFGHSPFASVKALNINVKLLPLLHKQIEVGKIALQGVELNLKKNKRGKMNWQGLVSHLQQEKVDATHLPPAQQPSQQNINISISDMALQDTTINWFNEQDNQQLVISKLALQSSNINTSEPFDITLSGAFTSTQPEITGHVKLAGNIQIANDKQQYHAKGLEMEGELLDKAFQAAKLKFNLKADANADLNKNTLSLTNIDATLANMQLRGDIMRKVAATGPLLTGNIHIPNFDALRFLQAIGITVPAMQDNKDLQKVSAQFALHADKSIAFNNLKVNVGETSALGRIIILDPKAKRFSTQLNINTINLANYLTPTKDHKVIKLSGLDYSGTLSLPEFKQQSLIQRLLTQGQLRTNSVQVDKTHITHLTANIQAKQGIITIAPVQAQLYQGQYKGNIHLNLQQAEPVIRMEQTFSHINIANLLHDIKPLTSVQMTGVGQITAKLSATGRSWQQARQSLTGKVCFAIDKGVLKGINLQHWLEVGTALYHHEPVPSSNVVNETKFGHLTGTMNIDHGVAHNDDLLLQSTFMRITGQGTVNLVKEHLNYLFKAVKINPANQQPRQDVIPIRVTGMFSNISVKPDIEQLLRAQVKKETAKQLDKLKEKASEQGLGKDLKDKVQKFDFNKFFGH